MLDKVFYVSKYEVILVYTHKTATLYSSDGKILEFLDRFLAPLSSECITLSAHKHRVKFGEEDTQVIEVA